MRDGPPWGESPWGPGGPWQGGPAGREAWRGFTRRVVHRFVIFFALGAIALSLIGGFVASMFFRGTEHWVRLGLGPIVVVLTALLIARYGLSTWRPVRELMTAAGSLADGDYSVRVPAEGSVAMRSVARSFNEMARRLESSDDQRRRLLADLGHELRTPLTVVRGEIEAMLDGVHAADPEHLGLLLDEVVVMERLIEDLRTLSLAEAGALALHPESTDLADLLTDVADGYRRAANDQGVAVEVRCDPSIEELYVDPVRIREVVTNLAVNSLRAMPDGGRLTFALTRGDGVAVLTVADTGSGMSRQEVEQMFERFRKGPASPGSGLGLTISRDLVEAHGGTLRLDSEPGVGTTARVTLPATR
jgi:signal transduction histidine kinase